MARTAVHMHRHSETGALLHLWEKKRRKVPPMISESISFYIRLFSLPLFLYFLILLNLSLRRSACLHVSNITSVSLISLSLCTSLLFHPFPLLSVTRLSFLSRSLISSHSSLIYRSVFCMSLTSLTAFPPPFPSIHFFFFFTSRIIAGFCLNVSLQLVFFHFESFWCISLCLQEIPPRSLDRLT